MQINVEVADEQACKGCPAQIVTEDGDVIRGRINREGADIGYISHFATCPNAAAHRRRDK